MADQAKAPKGSKSFSGGIRKSQINIERVRRMQSFAGKETDWQVRLFIHHFLDGRHRSLS